MKILVISSSSNEISSIKKGIKNANLKKNLNLDYLCTGIGSYNALSSLEEYLITKSDQVFIFNIGLCKYRNHEHKFLKEPVQLASITNINTEKEIIIPVFTEIAKLRHGFYSEKNLFSKPKLEKEIVPVNNERYFDMESRGIEYIALKYKVPHLILKVPNSFIYDKATELVAESGESQCNLLQELPYKDYLEKIIGWIDCQS